MKSILFAAGVLLSATAALSQMPAPAAAAPRDGVQTRTEVVQRVRAMFARADADRDGVVSQAEAQALRGNGATRRGARQADPARRITAFERMDANRDNMISRDEWTRAQEQRRQQMGARGERGARGQRVALRGPMGGAMLRAADANRDGRVSLQEAEVAALQRFDRVDVNRDGRITREERQQLRQQWRQQRGQQRG